MAHDWLTKKKETAKKMFKYPTTLAEADAADRAVDRFDPSIAKQRVYAKSKPKKKTTKTEEALKASIRSYDKAHPVGARVRLPNGKVLTGKKAQAEADKYPY